MIFAVYFRFEDQCVIVAVVEEVVSISEKISYRLLLFLLPLSQKLIWFQHHTFIDHDRGILTLDHVGLDEMENDIMRRIEAEGHLSRMLRAYARDVEPILP